MVSASQRLSLMQIAFDDTLMIIRREAVTVSFRKKVQNPDRSIEP
jgi:hypothetical protein